MVVPEAVRQRRRKFPPTKLSLFVGGRQTRRVMYCTIFVIIILGAMQGYYLVSRLASKASSMSIFGPRMGKGLCQNIPLSPPSVTWTKKRSQILKASQHPDDPYYSHNRWTEQLYDKLQPTLLSESIKSSSSFSSHANATRRILQVIQNKLSHPETAPPLKIMVVGGTSVEGRGCEASAGAQIPKGSIMGNPTYCAWPYRLEQFLNSILLPRSSNIHVDTDAGTGDGNERIKIVEVVNVGEEGTETALMTPLLRNRIFPKILAPNGPDIVINAYGAEDYIQSDFETVGETMQTEMAAFVSAAKVSRCCENAVFVDESGAEIDTQKPLEPLEPPLIINAEDSAISAISESSELSDVMTLNYNEIVSRINKWDKPKDAPPDVAFGMAGHVTLAWLVTYAVSSSIVDYCSNLNTPEIENMPSPEFENGNINPSSSPCVFAWFAGPAGTVKKANEITAYMTPFITKNSGWGAASDMSTGWSRKAGWEASAADASMEIEIKSLSSEVRFINLAVLRTNLPRFQDGLARFTLFVDEKRDGVDVREISFEIEGFHESDTHVTYPVEVDLKDYKAEVGSDVRLRIEMVKGNAYKILGMFFCS